MTSKQAAPVKFADIIIPSKGRFASHRATWHLLIADAVPFTVVVEPQEEKAYRDALETLVASQPRKSGYPVPQFRLAVLDANDRGVSYARNMILDRFAPKSGWFWIMDDDIRQFGRAVDRRVVELSAEAMLTEVARRMGLCVHLEHLGMFSLEYSQFSFSYDSDDAITLNSYANIAVCMNKSRMPAGIRYRLRVREDYDFALQMLQAGYCTLRFRNLSFAVPVMGTKAGGMTAYYDAQKADIRQQNRFFLEAWGQVAEEVEKGSGPSKRYDIRVRWSALSDIDEAVAILNSVPFRGFSSDPLATILTKSSRNGAVGKATKKADPCPPTTAPSGDKKRPRPVAAVPPAPRQPTAKGWQGWTVTKYRIITPETVAVAGLESIKPTPGQEVVYVPVDASQPLLLQGTVINVDRGCITVVPQRRGDPVCHCEHVFRVPDDFQEVYGLLATVYVD
jgi:hypothetical protein